MASLKNTKQPPQNQASPAQNMSDSKNSCTFPELMNRGRYTYVNGWNMPWRKFPAPRRIFEYRSFSAKEPYNQWFFFKEPLQNCRTAELYSNIPRGEAFSFHDRFHVPICFQTVATELLLTKIYLRLHCYDLVIHRISQLEYGFSWVRQFLECTVSKKGGQLCAECQIAPRIVSTWNRNSCTWLMHMWHGSWTLLIHTWHDSFRCDMTHAYMTWLMHMWHDSFIRDTTHGYATWLIHIWHDSFLFALTHAYVRWLIPMWHESFMCDVTHSRVTWFILICLDPCICDMTSPHLTWLIHMWNN